jgi:hypothetical protein
MQRQSTLRSAAADWRDVCAYSLGAASESRIAMAFTCSCAMRVSVALITTYRHRPARETARSNCRGTGKEIRDIDSRFSAAKLLSFGEA